MSLDLVRLVQIGLLEAYRKTNARIGRHTGRATWHVSEYWRDAFHWPPVSGRIEFLGVLTLRLYFVLLSSVALG